MKRIVLASALTFVALASMQASADTMTYHATAPCVPSSGFSIRSFSRMEACYRITIKDDQGNEESHHVSNDTLDSLLKYIDQAEQTEDFVINDRYNADEPVVIKAGRITSYQEIDPMDQYSHNARISAGGI